MDANRFDSLTRLFAKRRMSRRLALRQCGVCLTSGAFAATGLVPTVRAQATPAPPANGTSFTALVETILSPPRWFAGSDGRTHLVYELLLTNALPVPVTVREVTVLDGAAGRTLLHLDGKALLAIMSLATLPDTPKVQLPPSTVGAVWFDLPVANPDAIPMDIRHRLTVALPPGLPVTSVTSTGAAVTVDRRSPVVIGPPLAGPRWAALGSCCDGPHRRALIATSGAWYLGQRFAIDFNQLDAHNRPGTGDPSRYTSYPTYGQPVLAVADATVVESVDRYPDLNVGQAREDVTPDNAGGNRIMLDLGHGRYAGYAHLQAGSVMVRAGEAVRRGQHIANVGSSGTSGGPHLHFQVMDHPSILAADGLPYVFDAFVLTGKTPPLAEVLTYYDRLEPIPISTTGAGPRRTELPLGRDVVTFPSPADDSSRA